MQEALSNVAKHAPHTSLAEVNLAFHHDRLFIRITDQGPGLAADAIAAATPENSGAGGYGLIGMRERALSIGGRLHAGHRSTGGFEVSTELPLHPYSPAEDNTP